MSINHGDRRLSNEDARKRLLQTPVKGQSEEQALAWARKQLNELRRLPPVFPTIQTKQCVK